jgi:hypothetical protein
MIHSSRRDSKTKAIAEVLAMIADAHPEFAPHHPRPVCETEEWLWENATEFCAALDRYAGRARQTKKEEIITNMSRPAENVVAFYNKRGTCEQWIKEGKGAIRWTSASSFDHFTMDPLQ